MSRTNFDTLLEAGCHFGCSATNLLGDRDRLYAGYESIRTVSRRSGDATVHMPLDSRYLAAYRGVGTVWPGIFRQ